MNLKYKPGDAVEYHTRVEQWGPAWVPARVIEVNHSMDAAGLYTQLTLCLYNHKVIKLSEVEQRLSLRPAKSHWDKDKKEWVR